MVDDTPRGSPPEGALRAAWRRYTAPVPLLGWLLGALAAALLETAVGDAVAGFFGLPKIPLLFGFLTVFKEPLTLPGVLGYDLAVYLLPVALVGRLSAPPVNRLAAALYRLPIAVTVLVHLALLYAVLHLWSAVSDYRVLTLNLMLIAIMLTLSLNVINGYMGEFSCSHPGFMALGAYAASIFSLVLFANDRVFGQALLPAAVGPWLFPLALVAGGAMAALGALAIAIPSFRTRGDYLAIISLAFMFIVKSMIENLELVGGPRGLGGQPGYAGLTTVFVWCVLCVWIINNFVRSTLGKALNAVRDDETAAEAMTVNTRRTKMTAFMFGAFWAGVAGGLYAHVLQHVTPASFDLRMLAEMLAMVYFGGLNSVYGSIVGAVSLSVLSEALRPLELIKWICIPLLLILVMIFRPTGLVAFREFDVRQIVKPKG
jgi:branched-chain amino acid transport system permease protein